MEAHHLDPTTGEDEFALEAAGAGIAAVASAAPARARKAAQGPNPADPCKLGQGAAKRALSMRVWQEIQALPRRL